MSADEIRDQLNSLNNKVDGLGDQVEQVDRKQDDQLEILRGTVKRPQDGLISRVTELEKESERAAKWRQRMIGMAISAMSVAGGGAILWGIKAFWFTASSGH